MIAYQFLLAFDLLSSQIVRNEGKTVNFSAFSLYNRMNGEVVGIRPYNEKDVWLILFVEIKIYDDIFQLFETMSYVTFFDVVFLDN